MSCVVEQTARKIIHDPQSCIICRDKPHNYVPLLSGVLYPKCSVIVKGESKFAPFKILESLEKECDDIYGIVTCTHDLTEIAEDEAPTCKWSVLTTGEFDPYYICWPEGTTKELVDAYACQAACCIRFRWRTHCTALPEEYQYRLENVKAGGLAKTLSGPTFSGVASNVAATKDLNNGGADE